MKPIMLLLLSMSAPSLAQTQSYAASTTFTFGGNALPTGLTASNYIVTDSPKHHRFIPQNAYVSGGYLDLLVNGGQEHESVVLSAEVTTDFKVESASVETHAILSNEPGVCNGNFFYKSDTQEIDIEWLSDPNSKANVPTGFGRALFYTNQAVKPKGHATEKAGKPPQDATSAVHSYRIDWNSTSSTFYVDGKLQYEFTTNVPTAKNGVWVWNNWSNGDIEWSAGPPASDAVFKIEKIVMHYNPGS